MRADRRIPSALAGATSFSLAPRRFWQRADPRGDLIALVMHLGDDGPRSEELARALLVAEELLAGGSQEARERVVDWLEQLMLLASWPDTALTWPELVAAAPARCAAELTRLDALWLQVWAWCRNRPDRRRVDELADLTGEVRAGFRTAYRAMDDGTAVGLADVLVWEVSR